MSDPAGARRESSLQLTGRHATGRSASEVDLAALQRRGVRLTGRLVGASHGVLRFADDLAASVAVAETRMTRLLDAIDHYVVQVGLTDEVWPAHRPGPVPVPAAPGRLHLGAEGITSIVAATGYRPDHGWLDLPVLAADGSIDQQCGRTRDPGLYTVGQRFQHRRDSGLVAGAKYDAEAVSRHLLGRDVVDRSTDSENAA
jgi:putative flavoprotein involved in K+ transport